MVRPSIGMGGEQLAAGSVLGGPKLRRSAPQESKGPIESGVPSGTVGRHTVLVFFHPSVTVFKVNVL